MIILDKIIIIYRKMQAPDVELMPELTDRQRQLYEWLQTQPSVSVEETAQRLAISTATAYRDVRALTQAGLVIKTGHGVKLAPPAEAAPAQTDKCTFCAGTVSQRTGIVLQLHDGKQVKACCPHCGLMALDQLSVSTALAADFLYGRMINARQAVFLLESTVKPCCTPSVLCFASQDDAQRFQLGYGGQVCSLAQALARLHSIMALGT